MIYTAAELVELPTLKRAQCCSLKVDTGNMRVWLCRVTRGVAIERYRNGRWEVTQGSHPDAPKENPAAGERVEV